MEYGLLVEAERLEDVRGMDRVYHGAKLTAAAFNEPARIWEEHQQVRDALLSSTPAPREMSRGEWLARVAAIDRKMRRAGLVKPTTGELN